MLIFKENASDMVMCELANWNGKLYRISREELNEFFSRKDASHTGIYFLFGLNAKEEETLYIGEAEDIKKRIKQHLNDKNYWNEAFIIISKDNSLNKAHVKYLENFFYERAKKINRVVLLNSDTPTKSSVSEYDESMLKEFIENVLLLVNLLGKKSFIKTNKLKRKIFEKNLLYIKSAREADAQGMLINDGFVVLKGSKMAKGVTNSISKSLEKYRNSLIKSKKVVDYIFVDDYIFTSPSLAAAIVMGRNANGWTEWKNKDKKMLKDLKNDLE